MSRNITVAEFLVLLTSTLLVLMPEITRSADLPQRYAAACDQAAAKASSESGVPLDLMKAIARTESGITVQGSYVPWPWTINVEGRGKHLHSLEEARDAINGYKNGNVTNIDVGCFQVNHKWHGAEFSSIETMLDPSTNARYAARFLKELHGEFGNWLKAAAAYHSRNERQSEQYIARLIPILNDVRSSGSSSLEVADANEAPNTFPLLMGTSNSQSRGSLFPTATTSRGSLLMTSDIRG